MGTWGTGISSNDTYADVYDEFFDLYNDGADVDKITAKLIKENQETLESPDDANDFWFALAKAQWECKALDGNLLERVRTIVESGSDIEVWRTQDASSSDLRKREGVLQKFLNKISVDKPKPRRRKKVPMGTPTFAKGDCLVFKLSNGNFGGAVVLGSLVGKGYAYNLVAATRINQTNIPDEKAFRKANVLVCNFAAWEDKDQITWLMCHTFSRDAESFQLNGRLEIDKEFSFFDFMAGSSWKGSLIESVESQLDHEKSSPAPKKRLKVNSFLRRTWLPFL